MDNLILLAAIKRGFLHNALREIATSLDSVAFFLFSKVMQVMFDIMNVTAKADVSGFLQPLQSRIYVILSVYMLFKVTVSLITYMVNPDSLTDKNQGVGKLVQRIIVSVVMLIFFPIAFNFLNQVQADIIEDNTIGKLVLGVRGTYDNPEGIGTEIAFNIYNGTFMYNEGCDPGTPGACQINDSLSERTVTGLVEHINDPGSSNSEYKYGYIPVVGFAVGLVLAVVTLSMCIDVAIRVFKLIILQLIAPIPILSYIDPKASKDGAFSKWLKMTITVWTEVFVRLFIIYFILLVIVKLISDGGLLFDGTNVFVKIALVIGLLFFAKDAPKFIYDALGMKAPEKGMFSGLGSIMAAGAIGAGTVGSTIAGYNAAKLAAEANGKRPNLVRNVGAGLFGGLGGIGTGIGAAVNAKDHNARAVMEALSKRNDAAIAAGAAGSTAMGRLKSSASRLLTGQTLAMKGERSIASMKAQKDALSNIKSRVSGEMVKSDKTLGAAGSYKNGRWDGLRNSYGGAVTGKINYKDFMARKNAAAAAGQSSFRIETSAGSQLIDMKDAEKYQGLILKNNEDDYLINRGFGDAILNDQISIAEKTGATVTDRASVNGTIDTLGIEITRAEAENEMNKQNDRFAGKK